MSSLPNSLRNISLFLERLPGIGENTANRLTFFLLNLPEEDLKEFAKNVSDLKSKTKLCQNCFNFTEKDLCEICADAKRDQGGMCAYILANVYGAKTQKEERGGWLELR